jgi:Fe-S oxidoreductase
MDYEDSGIVEGLLSASAGGRILSLGMDQHVRDCCNGDKPPCRCACPFELDVNTFVSRLQKGSFSSAYTMYRDRVIFPAIVSRLCDRPCENACVRKDLDDPIDMSGLEKAAVAYAASTKPVKYNIPRKAEKAAVIGAGLCGLSCAARLSARGYGVTLFEKSGQIGGRLRGLYPDEDFYGEIHNQTGHLDLDIRLSTEIPDAAALLGEYGAVLIATGEGGADFGLTDGLNLDSLGTARDGVFMAGSILGGSPMRSIENGSRAALSIENFLKTGRMHIMQGIETDRPSRLRVNLQGAEKKPALKPAADTGYTKEAARGEAGRCLKCDCTECMKACDFLQSYKKLPKKIVADVRVTLNSVDQLSPRIATRLISSCNICGLCSERCTESIDMGEFLLDARRIMHREGSLPPVFHDFWIRDLRFTMSDSVYLARNAPFAEKSEYLFFPGCQLGASDPRYVTRTYQYLLEQNRATGLMLACCGIPAEWAGDERLAEETVGRIRSDWRAMGSPVVITACPTCEKMFRKHLPEVNFTGLYDIINKNGLPVSYEKPGAENEKTCSVFDPCSSRYDPDMQRSVRELTAKAGLENLELPSSGETAVCCGNGGHVYSANPELHKTIAAKRAQMGGAPYVTYCTNCRDTFAELGKPCRHILDILFGLNHAGRKPPSLSQRRENRILLRETLLKDVWSEGEETNASAYKEETKMELIISPELTEKLNRLMILEGDVRRAVEHCETTGSKVFSPARDCCIGHHKQGYMTYWVAYKKDGGAFRILNAYSHRLVLTDEG